MFAAHNLRHRLEKLELALVAKSEPPEIQFSYRVHTAQRLDDLRVTECADAPEGTKLVFDYIAVRQGDEWRLSGEAHQRPASGPDDQGKIITSQSRSEEHTSELQSHSEISYAVFCLKKKI